MDPIATFHIHLKGRVQGVGFRPFVWRLAQARQLKGWVSNTSDGLHIEINANAAQTQAFLTEIQQNAPKLAQITQSACYSVADQLFEQFTIVHSDPTQDADLLLTPDFGLCADCRAEMKDPANRRYNYPFITCTLCGPRFSILTGLPYDRPLTTMAAFEMCPDCLQEYHNPDDRRYFSQTNSCATCGVQLHFESSSRSETKDAIPACLEALQQGQIVAVKGIGGYLLLCDATNSHSIQALRARKRRPAKPFAVLYPNEEMLGGDVKVSTVALEYLQSSAAPIVLLPLQNNPESGIQTDDIAPGLNQLGVMLPYAPLLELLASGFGKPLIATSANRSGAPIVADEMRAKQDLADIADAFLHHNRPIEFVQDDSVLRLTPQNGQAIWMRRSRGIAPSLVQNHLKMPAKRLFCAGADLKSTFALNKGDNLYVSPYLGNLEDYDVQEHYRGYVSRLKTMLQVEPELVVADLHPGYHSRALAQELANAWQAEFREVQHHEAHFAAVLAENDLLENKQPVLGFIWDGTGYGHDGQIWGGECMIWENGQISRTAHWDYFPVIAQDKMAREPRLSALSVAHSIPGASEWLEPKFSRPEWIFYRQVLQQQAAVNTCSMGRILDAVASLLGLINRQSFEGEAPMLLEALAQKGAAFNIQKNYTTDCFSSNKTISTTLFFQNILEDIESGVAPEIIAYNVHWSLAHLIRQVAEQRQIKQLAFSGGVFQNALLVDLILQELSPGYRLYFHKELPPNDECISYGQFFLMRN